MRKNRQRLIDYLQHMQEAVLRIQKYIGNCDENTFIGNELVQNAVIRNLEVIGEASQNINKFYPEYIKENESISFLAAYEMRNALKNETSGNFLPTTFISNYGN